MKVAVKLKALPFLMLSASVLAEEVELEQIDVLGEAQFVVSKKHDVTGLGAVRKSAEQLQYEQVENIRDVARYDPDIGVNEGGGRGTTRGFAMRGVEQERVAVSVDGFAAAPIFKRDSLTAGQNRIHESSSAMMEQEYENLKEIDLRKGSASAESGSGALGGAVSMMSKDASDFFKDDEAPLAGRLKLGHTSKDDRSLVSFALAGRKAGFSGFAQFTQRHGHEIKAHEDLYRDGLLLDGLYITHDVTATSYYFPNAEVSGPQRRTPNPLDYKSHSFLSKAGYHFSSAHYLGLVVEDSRQQYQLRDMTLSNYHRGGSVIKGEYSPIFGYSTFTGLSDYTPTRFYIDEHKTKRVGFEYQYSAQGSQSFLDSALLRFDRRELSLSSEALDLNCAPWPTVDIDCFPSDQDYRRGQMGKKHYSRLDERDYRFDASLEKTVHWGEVAHEMQVKLGVMDSEYQAYNTFNKQFNLDSDAATNRQDSSNFHQRADTTGKINGKNYFVSFSDRIRFSPKLEMSFALRNDWQSFKANPKPAIGLTFEKASYRNFSWDFGVAYRPFESWQFTYRASSGFRNPSIMELIGPNFNSEEFNSAWQTQGPLKAERSLNQEVGLSFSNDLLFIEGSYFITRYKDLIGRAAQNRGSSGIGQDELYHNLYNFTTHGFDVKSYVNAHALWGRLPDGLEFRFGAGVSKIKKQDPVPAGYDDSNSNYSFDAISPFRMVYGLEYNAPSGNWGVSLLTTYSRGKNPDELVAKSQQGGLTTQGARVANIRTGSWRTTDVTGYFHYDDWLTLRLGVYNLFNYRYITWESARQSALGREANMGGVNNYSALAAPGRNILLNFEVRF